MTPPELSRLDRISLDQAVFYGYHGVNPAERELGQRFVVDVTVWADLRQAGATDDLEQTINYASLYKTARAVVEGESCRLLEAVATRLAEAILREYPVQAVRVKLTKPNPPIRGSAVGAAAVQILRERRSDG